MRRVVRLGDYWIRRGRAVCACCPSSFLLLLLLLLRLLADETGVDCILQLAHLQVINQRRRTHAFDIMHFLSCTPGKASGSRDQPATGAPLRSMSAYTLTAFPSIRPLLWHHRHLQVAGQHFLYRGGVAPGSCCSHMPCATGEVPVCPHICLIIKLELKLELQSNIEKR